MIPDPSDEAIQAWANRYNNSRELHDSYMEFQRYVYGLFESLRRETGLRLIRSIIQRDSVKSFDSILQKILEKMENQRDLQEIGKLPANAKPYDYDDIEDYVGIKVLCPYRSNSDEVAKLLFDRFKEERKLLRVVEQNPAEGRRDSEGYKGYNFTILPPANAQAQWILLKCEVQIKTLLEEAWDAKTHDYVYKRKRLVSPLLSKQFDLLSEALEVVEHQSEGIRKQVEEIPLEQERQKNRAALVYFSKFIQANIPSAPELTHAHTPLSTVDVQHCKAFIESQNQRLSIVLCNFATYIAIRQGDPGLKTMALRMADTLVERAPQDPLVEDARAGIHWGLSRYRTSVYYADQARQKMERQRDQLPPDKVADVLSNYAYYIADATLFGQRVAPEHTQRARQVAVEVCKSYPKALGYQDTLGWVLIRFGSEEEVEEGIEMVKQARKQARERGNTYQKQTAEAFCSRHIRLGRIRLVEIEANHPQT